ncbi:MAG: peptidylprolyl isomerase [Pseudomonadota bacterium]
MRHLFARIGSGLSRGSARVLAILRREPLAQFCVIGLILFALDRGTTVEADDPFVIRVDAQVQRELAGLFREGRNRLPRADEMDELIRSYVQSEVLVREARALRLDEGDQMVRERLAQRVRLMIYAGIEVANPPEDVVRAWYESNAEVFTYPETLSFQMLQVDATEADAVALVERLEAGAQAEDIAPQGRIPIAMHRRPLAQLNQTFGADFVGAILEGEVRRWRAVPSPRGWQVVRNGGADDGYVPPFEEVRDEAEAQWRKDALSRQAKASFEAIQARYRTEADPIDPGLIFNEEKAGEGAAQAAAGAAQAAQ